MKSNKNIWLTAVTLYLFITSAIAGDSIFYVNVTDTTISRTASVTKTKEIKNEKNSINAFIKEPYAVHISVKGTYNNLTARIYDLLGKEVQRCNFTNVQNYIWNIDNKLKGVYLLKLQTENSSLVKKIILN